jgi:hypothetical protein
MTDSPPKKFWPIENKYVAAAAAVAFMLTLLVTRGSLLAAFGSLTFIAGIGWIAHRLSR